jgi:hypothetical protein
MSAFPDLKIMESARAEVDDDFIPLSATNAN